MLLANCTKGVPEHLPLCTLWTIGHLGDTWDFGIVAVTHIGAVRHVSVHLFSLHMQQVVSRLAVAAVAVLLAMWWHCHAECIWHNIVLGRCGRLIMNKAATGLQHLQAVQHTPPLARCDPTTCKDSYHRLAATDPSCVRCSHAAPLSLCTF